MFLQCDKYYAVIAFSRQSIRGRSIWRTCTWKCQLKTEKYSKHSTHINTFLNSDILSTEETQSCLQITQMNKASYILNLLLSLPLDRRCFSTENREIFYIPAFISDEHCHIKPSYCKNELTVLTLCTDTLPFCMPFDKACPCFIAFLFLVGRDRPKAKF